jgi:hypothetical protein
LEQFLIYRIPPGAPMAISCKTKLIFVAVAFKNKNLLLKFLILIIPNDLLKDF